MLTAPFPCGECSHDRHINIPIPIPHDRIEEDEIVKRRGITIEHLLPIIDILGYCHHQAAFENESIGFHMDTHAEYKEPMLVLCERTRVFPLHRGSGKTCFNIQAALRISHHVLCIE